MSTLKTSNYTYLYHPKDIEWNLFFFDVNPFEKYIGSNFSQNYSFHDMLHAQTDLVFWQYYNKCNI